MKAYIYVYIYALLLYALIYVITLWEFPYIRLNQSNSFQQQIVHILTVKFFFLNIYLCNFSLSHYAVAYNIFNKF